MCARTCECLHACACVYVFRGWVSQSVRQLTCKHVHTRAHTSTSTCPHPGPWWQHRLCTSQPPPGTSHTFFHTGSEQRALTYGDGSHALRLAATAVGDFEGEAVGPRKAGAWHVHKRAVGVEVQGAVGGRDDRRRAQRVLVGVAGVCQHARRGDRQRLPPPGGVGHCAHDRRAVDVGCAQGGRWRGGGRTSEVVRCPGQACAWRVRLGCGGAPLAGTRTKRPHKQK
jgi:hypothetical protein